MFLLIVYNCLMQFFSVVWRNLRCELLQLLFTIEIPLQKGYFGYELSIYLMQSSSSWACRHVAQITVEVWKWSGWSGPLFFCWKSAGWCEVSANHNWFQLSFCCPCRLLLSVYISLSLVWLQLQLWRESYYQVGVWLLFEGGRQRSCKRWFHPLGWSASSIIAYWAWSKGSYYHWAAWM